MLTVKILGTNAEPILPELNTLFRSCNDANVMPALANMIAAVGPKGTRCLTGAITDRTGNQCLFAISTIKRLARSDAEITMAVSALLSVINDPRNAEHRVIRAAATNALKTIAPEALTNQSTVK